MAHLLVVAEVEALAIVGSTVAVLGAFASILFAMRSERLSRFAQKQEYLRDLRAWGSRVLEVLAKGSHLFEESAPGQPVPVDARVCREVRAALSALIDEGRWFFPNTHEHVVGQKKESAFKGLRQPVLDALIEAYESLGPSPTTESRRRSVVGAQRLVASFVQDHLEPRWVQKALDVALQPGRSVEGP